MARTREQLLAAKKLYRENNKEKIREARAKYKQKLRDQGIKRKTKEKPGKAYKRLYGITEDDFQRMLKEQNYVCKICLQPETATRNGKVKRLSIDHCHTTGKVRGLICHSCNTVIGRYKDDAETFKRFVEHLIS
jgi:hypothetical protein